MKKISLFLPAFLAMIHSVFAQSVPQQPTVREIASRSIGSVVLLEMKGSPDGETIGSGFFVGPDVIATNKHVIRDALSGSAKIVGTDKTYEVLGVLGVDSQHDLALVKVRGITGKPMKFGDVAALAVGDEVFAIGSPEGLEGTFSQGIVSSMRGKTDHQLIQITASIAPGSSGGPVLNRNGDVIGVAVGGIRGEALNFAIPVSFLKALLANQKPLISLSATQDQLAREGADSAGTRPDRDKESADPSQSVRPKTPDQIAMRKPKAPSLTTGDVAQSHFRDLAISASAITRVHISTESRSGRDDHEWVFKSDGDCSFTMSSPSYVLDQNHDGIADRLPLNINCVTAAFSLDMSTFNIGQNLSVGTFRKAISSHNSSLPLPQFSFYGAGAGCTDGRTDFQIDDLRVDMSRSTPELISLGLAFETTCQNGNKIKGTLLYNYEPKTWHEVK